MDTLLKFKIAWIALFTLSITLIVLTAILKWSVLFFVLGGLMFIIGFLFWMVWGMAKGGM